MCGAAITYSSFREISENERYAQSYSVLVAGKNSDTVILALHGGGIEPGTEELALEVHEPEEGLFIFSGIKKTGNRLLHITSTKFDHPEALELVENSVLTIAIHGAGGKEPITYLGGLCEKGIRAIAEELTSNGFHVSTKPPPGIDGKDPQNIVNKNLRKKGVQVEISEAQRAMFFKGLHSRILRQQKTEIFYEYAKALRAGINRAKNLIFR